jgi:hypothetical protein
MTDNSFQWPVLKEKAQPIDTSLARSADRGRLFSWSGCADASF